MTGFIEFMLGLSIFIVASFCFAAISEIKREIAELRAVTRWLGVKRSEGDGMDNL